MSGAEAAVGVVASGAGLASLAIQLIESGKKIKALVDDVKDAPEDLKDNMARLEGLSRILERLGSCQDLSNESTVILKLPMETCCKNLKKLESNLQAIKKRMTGSLKGKIKAALRKDTVTKILTDLGRDIQALDLALSVDWKYRPEKLQEQQTRDQLMSQGTVDRERREERLQRISDQLLAQGTLLERILHQHLLAGVQNAQQIAQLITPIIAPSRRDMCAAGSQQYRVAPSVSETVIKFDKRVKNNQTARKPWPSEQTERLYMRKSKQIFRLRTSLLPFFKTRIWELAVLQAGSGWQASLQTYNIVPVNSKIFKLCESGDIHGVDRLVRSGHASLLDHDGSGGTLLQRTLFSPLTGDVKKFYMCKYLLENSPFPDRRQALLDGLSQSMYHAKFVERIMIRHTVDFFSRDANDAEKLDDYNSLLTRPFFEDGREATQHHLASVNFQSLYFRLFIQKHGLDMDIDDAKCLGAATDKTTAESWNIIVFSQPVPLSLNSLRDLLGIIIDHGVSARAHELSYVFGLDIFSRQMARLKDHRGRSALHIVAAGLKNVITLSPGSSSILKEWFDLGVRLIKNGAKPHGGNDKNTNSILAGYFRDIDARLSTRVTLVRLWAKLLNSADVNLRTFGDAEIADWGGTKSFLDYTLDGPQMCRLLYGYRPEHWGIHVQPLVRLQVYEWHDTPGTFAPISTLPRTIFWYPSWEKGFEGEWRLASERHHHRSSDTAVTYYAPPENPHTALADMINSTQDDTTILPYLLEREKRGRTGKRSNSQPPLTSRRISLARGMIIVHQCPLDGKYRIGCKCINVQFLPEHEHEYKRVQIDIRHCVHAKSDKYNVIHSRLLLQLKLDSERKNEGRKFRAERSAQIALSGLAEKGGFLRERH